ncbi:MAG: DMT family transporter [Actinobacteria bacterium]|nr:DMT family transporter [Actinomycetota bacterium]
MSQATLTPSPTATSLTAAFAPRDWALLAGIALTWGSSFVFIEVALENFQPALIAFLRILFGAMTVVWVRRAREPVVRSDWGAIIVVGLLWMAIPFLLFPIAQQWIDSSLAGMINGAVPLFAALVATLISRKLPGVSQAVGLIIGFAGVVAVSWPAVQGARSTATGVLLVLLATVCYGVALNVVVPLQRKYGSLPILLRVQAVALLLTVVPAAIAATDSTFAWSSVVAIVPLGCLGTGLAFVWMTVLAGRVGPSRGSVTIYFIPVVAIVLGTIFRDESIALVSLFGTALVLVGAYLTSRAEHH